MYTFGEIAHVLQLNDGHQPINNQKKNKKMPDNHSFWCNAGVKRFLRWPINGWKKLKTLLSKKKQKQTIIISYNGISD